MRSHRMFSAPDPSLHRVTASLFSVLPDAARRRRFAESIEQLPQLIALTDFWPMLYPTRARDAYLRSVRFLEHSPGIYTLLSWLADEALKSSQNELRVAIASLLTHGSHWTAWVTAADETRSATVVRAAAAILRACELCGPALAGVPPGD